MSLSIGIVGTGALGTLMAWHWREQNLFIRQRTTSALSLLADSLDTFAPYPWVNQPLDWLVITTKAADTLEALNSVKSNLSQVKRILLLQNGMGQHDQVADWLRTNFPSDLHLQSPELWAATSTEGAYRHPEGYVVYAGKGETFAGPWPQHKGSINHSAASVVLQPEGLPPGVIFDPNITQRLQAKLAINAIINPLTGYYRCKNGELLKQSEYLIHFKKLAKEVSDTFQQLAWSIPFNIEQQAEAVAKATANNQSSTLQDILNKRATELPYITGYLLEQAQQHNIAMPITSVLHQKLQQQLQQQLQEPQECSIE